MYRLAQIGSGNFGDFLNDFLWTAVCVDIPENYGFLGIGTLLSEHYCSLQLSEYNRILCFGSGAGLGRIPTAEQLSAIDFRFVRGPITARVLGLDSTLSITDPAAMIMDDSVLSSLKCLLKRSLPDDSHGDVEGSIVSVIPHYSNPANDLIKNACRVNGFRLLDVSSSPLFLIECIERSSLVLCEAMHGAIVADSLGIPWIPFVRSHAFKRQFKWHDWCLSVGLEYCPSVQPYINLYDIATRRKDAVRNGEISHQWYKQTALSCAIGHASAVPSRLANMLSAKYWPSGTSVDEQVDRFSIFMHKLAALRPCLSGEATRRQKAERMLNICKTFSALK